MWMLLTQLNPQMVEGGVEGTLAWMPRQAVDSEGDGLKWVGERLGSLGAPLILTQAGSDPFPLPLS